MSPLDRAIVEYRANPSEENRQRVLALQTAHVQAQFARDAASYIRRTR